MLLGRLSWERFFTRSHLGARASTKTQAVIHLEPSILGEASYECSRRVSSITPGVPRRFLFRRS